MQENTHISSGGRTLAVAPISFGRDRHKTEAY